MRRHPFICLFILILLLITSVGKAEMDLDHIYPETLIVEELDYENDLVFLRDFNGYLWAIEEVQDWEIGDVVSVIFYDCDTDDIFDDEIVYIRYSGYIEGWAANG